jgi:Ulp1 family protease
MMGMLQERHITGSNSHTHFFLSSYFMERLAGLDGLGFDFNQVARWTKNVEVFDTEQVLLFIFDLCFFYFSCLIDNYLIFLNCIT